MTVEDFKSIPAGQVVRLSYDAFNKDNFLWRHYYVNSNNRIVGSFKYDDGEWSPIRDYLYEFNGKVCRGSGAEPVKFEGIVLEDKKISEMTNQEIIEELKRRGVEL